MVTRATVEHAHQAEVVVAALLLMISACGGRASADARPSSYDASSNGGAVGDPCDHQICGIYLGGNGSVIEGGAGGAGAGAAGAPNHCTPDGAHCESSGECCSGGCAAKTCISYPQNCKTMGNPCRASVECCSLNCADGTCAFAVDAGSAGAASVCAQDAQACDVDAG